MVKEANVEGQLIVQRFFDEHGTDHTQEEINQILKESGFSIARYYQLRTRYIKKHSTVDDEVRAFLEKIKPHAESGKNANYARLYAQIMGFLEKREVSNEPTPTDINKIAIRVRDSLRKKLQKDGGNCPVCGLGEALCPESCLDTEPEHEGSGEVAGVGVSA